LRTWPSRASLAGVSRRGTLRASDADREGIVERLHRAATEGRIAAEELEERVTTALKARTYDELERTVADLPGPHGRRELAARHSVAQWALATVRTRPILLLFLIPAVAVTVAMVLAATIVWLVLMVVVAILSGRSGVLAPPWSYHRRHELRDSHRGGAGRYWA
jgi:hypothetical protein